MLNAPTLSVSLAGLAEGTGARELIAWVRATGVRSLRLDAARRGLRPRELDRSARRDLAATLRREELGLAGLDLWIPAVHFGDDRTMDRAVTALLGAIDLAGALADVAGGARPGVGVCLGPGVGEDVLAVIGSRADGSGVRVVDHAWASSDDPRVVVGVDPATVLLGGGDPGEVSRGAGGRLGGARLSDASDSGRCVVGASGGRLDLAGYIGGLLGAGYAGDVAIDLRGLEGPEGAVASALALWEGLVPG